MGESFRNTSWRPSSPLLSINPSLSRSWFNGGGGGRRRRPHIGAPSRYLLALSLLVICTNTMVWAHGEQRMEDGHEMWNKKEGRGGDCLCPLIQEEYENPCALWYFSTSWAAPT